MEKIYTYEDWLEDELPLSPFPDDFPPGKKQYSMLSPSILFAQNRMSRETFDLIVANQKEAYDRALEMHFMFHKSFFDIDCRNSINPKEYIEIERNKLKKEKEDNIELYQHALKEKAFFGITGGDYQRICEYWTDYIEDGRFHAFKLNLTWYEKIFNMHLLIKRLEYIEEIFSNYTQITDREVLNDLNSVVLTKQIPEILKILIKEKIISKETSLEDFKVLFSSKSLPFNFKRIKWILLTRKGQPHKTALREFLTLIYNKCPKQKIIDFLFTDVRGNPIKLAKPKANEFSNYYSFFEKLFKD